MPLIRRIERRRGLLIVAVAAQAGRRGHPRIRIHHAAEVQPHTYSTQQCRLIYLEDIYQMVD